MIFTSVLDFLNFYQHRKFPDINKSTMQVKQEIMNEKILKDVLR